MACCLLQDRIGLGDTSIGIPRWAGTSQLDEVQPTEWMEWNHLKCSQSAIWLKKNASSIPHLDHICLRLPTNKGALYQNMHFIGFF
nr:hypothetical protein Q903MT_gene456 [Picea sitchensis]